MPDLADALAQLADAQKAAAVAHANRIAAEDALLHEVRRLMDAGEITEEDVDELFVAVKDDTVKGFTSRWYRIVGVPYEGIGVRRAKRRRDRARSTPNGPGGVGWVGVAPLDPTDPRPLPGTSVVYVLYDAANEPIYVGSTEYFQIRLWNHLRHDKPVARWMAYPCTDRQAAYEMETQMLRQSKPPLNARASR